MNMGALLWQLFPANSADVYWINVFLVVFNVRKPVPMHHAHCTSLY